MEYFDVIRTRRSVRKFTSKNIDDDIMTTLLKAIRTAPTAGNLQAYQVYLAQTSDKISALAKATGDQECVSGAKAVLVFCTDAPRSASKYGERGTNLYCVVDTTIAATIAHLTAVALGLGGVIVGAFKPEEVSRIVGAPLHQTPILMLPLGYPDEIPVPTDRRPLDDLVMRL